MVVSESGEQLKWDALHQVLSRRHCHAPITILRLTTMDGSVHDDDALKQFGYGAPLLIEYSVDDQVIREVIHRIRPTQFGRERPDDRAAAIWLDYTTFGRLPRHVPARDIVARCGAGRLVSLREAQELLLITAYQPGTLYAADLIRLRDGGEVEALDLERAGALARYLAQIHRRECDDPALQPALWRRRLRDLIGHGECIMGLADSYPADDALASEDRLQHIERLANRWRWRLKGRTHRLRQVHGDFHPFNILFGDQSEFWVLDRSRGEWGEPADDVSCLCINYIFFGLQRTGDLSGAFRTLYDHFWQTYLAERNDMEILEVIPPWFAWRSLVLASPIWYPTIRDAVRGKLFRFCEQVLTSDHFDYQHPEHYWQGDG